MNSTPAVMSPTCTTPPRSEAHAASGAEGSLAPAPVSSAGPLPYLLVAQLDQRTTFWTRAWRIASHAPLLLLWLLILENERLPESLAKLAVWIVPSLLLLLSFALIIAKTTGWTVRGGLIELARRLKLQKRVAADDLFAAVFWSLREQGRITIELVEDKSLFFFNRTRLMAGRVKRDHSESPSPVGIERDILMLVPEKERLGVQYIVHRWFPGRTPDPWAEVKLAAAQGVATADQAGGYVEDVVAQWRRFQTGEPMLYNALLRACNRGIGSRTKGLLEGIVKSMAEDD